MTQKLLYLLLFSTLILQSCADRKSTEPQESPSPDQENSESNIGFRARGNEPFWMLEIDFNQRMHFKTIDSLQFDLYTSLPEPVRPQDADAVRFSAGTEEGSLQVNIFRRKCTDSMSGQEFSYEVTVVAQKTGMEKEATYSGCGEYLGDYRLNDIWGLESINGKPIDAGAEAPNLEFHLAEQRFYGFGGCNRINGQITLTDESIQFGPAMATKMACPDLQLETRFLQLISDRTFNFQLGERKLTLNNEEATLVFRKVD